MRDFIPGKSAYLRLVKPEDAAELVRLRNQDRCRVGLHPTPPEIEHQARWLEAYSLRAREEGERYFIIGHGADHRVLGAMRIHDLQGATCRMGSWVVDENAPRGTALQSVLLIYDELFVLGDFTETRLDVQTANHGSLRFHPKMGSEIVRQDAQQTSFRTSRESYLSIRSRYERWLPMPVLGDR